jgi:dipeptidase E
MRVLLGSGGFRTDERIRFLNDEMRSFFGGVSRLLFVPYALADHDGYVQKLIDKKINAGYELDGLHRHTDVHRAVVEAPAIFVGGGNTFRLLKTLYDLDLIDVIRTRVREGMPYLGISAGANLACPTVKTTNDMQIALPPRLDALNLVPFQINPHYYFGQMYVKEGESYREHFGETRDERIREFHEMNDTPVVGLWEGGILRVEQGQCKLLGTSARIFRKGQEPVDVPAGSMLEGMM